MAEKTARVGIFEIKVSPNELELPADGSVELPVEVVWTRPPAAEVDLTAQVEPAGAGVKATLNPSRLVDSGTQAMLVIQADKKATGQRQLRVQGQSGTQKHEVTLKVRVVR
ncbi:MAG: hypothetical protein SNJ82_08545 [Gemmataceae bacterium]